MYWKKIKIVKIKNNYYTTNTWGNLKDYDLCINSDMGLDNIADLIVQVYQSGSLWRKEEGKS